jgi:hypothetical protein
MANDAWEHCRLEKNDLAIRDADGSVRSDPPKIVLTYHGPVSFEDALAPEKWDRAIGQLGREGWELVSATDTVSDFGNSVYLGVTKLYFKRRAREHVSQPLLQNL